MLKKTNNEHEYVRKEYLELIVSRIKSRLDYLSSSENNEKGLGRGGVSPMFLEGVKYALEYFKEYENFLISIDELRDGLL